jgi:hypothetical protein
MLRSKKLTVYGDREILVSAMCDEITEEIFRQLKVEPLSLEKEIRGLCSAIETRNRVHFWRNATIRVVARLIIMALDLQP